MNRPRAWPALLLLCALAFVQRAGVVAAPRGDLYGNPAGGDLGIKIGEEIARGNVAVDLLEGPVLPLLDYQYAHFFGGSLVVGVLTVPSFALFGPTLWALKLVPILIHLAGVVLLFRLLDRHVSRRAAVLGGLLYGLSPPGYTLLTTINWGSHVESNVLALLALSLHLGLRESDRRVARRFALGVVMGFGLYFGYQTALFVAALTAFDLPRANRPSLREAGAQLGGALVGFLPWLVYNLRHDFAGLSVYGKGVGEHVAGASPFARLSDLFVRGFPGTLFFGDRALEVTLALAFGGLMLAGMLLRRRSDRGRALPALMAGVYSALFLVAFALSDFEVGFNARPTSYRYAMLLAPWIAIAAACGLDALAERGARSARVAWGAGLAIAATCFVATWLTSCDASRLGDDRHAPGADLRSHGMWLCMKMSHEPEGIPALVDNILAHRDRADQRKLFFEMGDFLLKLGKIEKPNRADQRRRDEAARLNHAADRFHAEVPEEHKAFFRR